MGYKYFISLDELQQWVTDNDVTIVDIKAIDEGWILTYKTK